MQDVNIKIPFKASFILNFKWKALKITLKTVTVPARRSTRLPKNLFDGQAFRHAGVSVLRVHYSRKILKKEKKPDANRDG
jgi:hypothetical protein